MIENSDDSIVKEKKGKKKERLFPGRKVIWQDNNLYSVEIIN